MALTVHTVGRCMCSVCVDADPLKFDLITRRTGHGRVLQSISRALELGVPSVKVNCVVMRGFNDSEIVDFVEFTRDKPVEVRFIE